MKDVDRIGFQPAFEEVLVAVEAIELPPCVQHRRLSRADTTFGTSKVQSALFASGGAAIGVRKKPRPFAEVRPGRRHVALIVARQPPRQVSRHLFESEANVMRRARDDDDGFFAQAAIPRIHGAPPRSRLRALEHAGCGANRCTV